MAPTAPDFGPRIDPYTPYEPQRDCDPTAKPGVAGFRDLVLAAYAGTRALGISRAWQRGPEQGYAWNDTRVDMEGSLAGGPPDAGAVRRPASASA
ncbi:hypothetical protein [Streptomyces sp. NPDC052496]|uniref:hypothetical protein n=1 Tax=Streptomyces sp. NPDC052496 TaxID=3154951 RepID=UPI003423463F